MAANLPEDFSRYDQKLEFILRTSARIFAEKGFHSTSMRDIARETRVSLAGLYYYCKSKDELLFLIQDNCFGHVLERLEARLKETTDPVERFRLVVENHLSFFAANMAEMKVLSHEAESLAGEMYEKVAGKKQQYTRTVRRILAEVQARRTDSDKKIDLTVATYALFGMMNWIYNWYDPRGKLSVAELVETFARLFLSGILPGTDGDALAHPADANGVERLSVWRAVALKPTLRQK
ncbi:MAG: TetR/AcrR family transcriptional regulator, cholesterol catabolism regulator [Acidobacteriota bacterium]|jgi:AcrR family transcriptional regulator|nr:TetR/AcrR family transcriptional regulator, cholesterol catabolism regulator [Acidobacteriota bacterium]